MSGGRPSCSAEEFGRDVLGPVVAEFCLRLWQLTSQLEHPDDAALLFCARGGLRMQLAHERFLDATSLRSPSPLRPLMVSRLAAVRPVLVRSLDERRDDLRGPAASALDKEYQGYTVAQVVKGVSGQPVDPASPAGAQPYTSVRVAAFLRSQEGAAAAQAVREQSELFLRHLREQLQGRSHALLVDTGLYGTTRDLIAGAGLPETVSCALIARSFRPGIAADHRTYGLTSTTHDYSPSDRRTVLLRYWHFVEWLFEPELPSVTRFTETSPGGRVVSDLEVSGWSGRVAADPGSSFAGVVAYLESLAPGSAARVVSDAGRAWSRLHRVVVAPRQRDVVALTIGRRTHGFGREEEIVDPERRSLRGVLFGDAIWREGELARDHGLARLPGQAALQAAYVARSAARAVSRRLG